MIRRLLALLLLSSLLAGCAGRDRLFRDEAEAWGRQAMPLASSWE